MPTEKENELLLSLVVSASRFVRSVTYSSQLGVSSVSWRVIILLDNHGQLRPSEISSLEKTSRATTTTMLKRLETERLIERVPDPEDGRSFLVQLTTHGKEELAQWRSRIHLILNELAKELTPKQLETLSLAQNIISEITAKMEQNRQ